MLQDTHCHLRLDAIAPLQFKPYIAAATTAALTPTPTQTLESALESASASVPVSASASVPHCMQHYELLPSLSAEQLQLLYPYVEAFLSAPVDCFYLQTVTPYEFVVLHDALFSLLAPELEQGWGLGQKKRFALYLGLHPLYLPSDSIELAAQMQLFTALLREHYVGMQESTTSTTSTTSTSCSASLVHIAGIGEIGLDKRATASIELQKEVLAQLLSIDKTLRAEHAVSAAQRLPLSLHCVGLHQDLQQLIRKFYPMPQSAAGADQVLPRVGTIHGFNGSVELAKQYYRQGLRIGLGKAVLAPQNEAKFRAMLTQLPSSTFCLESDFDGSCSDFYEARTIAEVAARVQHLRA